MIIKRKLTTSTVEEITISVDCRNVSAESSPEIGKEIETAKDLLESVDNLNLNRK